VECLVHVDRLVDALRAESLHLELAVSSHHAPQVRLGVHEDEGQLSSNLTAHSTMLLLHFMCFVVYHA